MKKYLQLFSVVLLLGSTAAADVTPLDQRVVEHTCANGINLLVLERHFSPNVSIRMIFRTGSVDESSGKSGLAHMFEHMMFKGTHTLGTKNYAAEAALLPQLDALHQQIDAERAKGDKADQARIAALLDQLNAVEAKASSNVVQNELWNLYEREGASDLNANTSHDYTQYVVDLPSNKLELWAMLDSDRVRNPVFRQFYSEREVVKEERRMRVDTDPGGKLYEEFLSTAFSAHPYRIPTIGWESDLNHLSIADLEDFYHRFYTPDQLTIAVVGDVKAQHVIDLVEHYFGPWKTPAVARPPISDEPPQSGPRRVTVNFDAQPEMAIGYHIPAYPNPERLEAFALAQILGNGTTSRLYKNLVEKQKVAAEIETSEDYPGERYGALLIISATPRHPYTNADVEKAIRAELEKLKKQPIADWEMEKFRASVDVGLLNTLQTNAGMAETLAYDQAIFGDWKYLLWSQKKIKDMKASDLQAAAQKIFVPSNEVVGTLETIKKPPTPRGSR